MTLGEYIKNLRKEKELSQWDLAEKSGVSNAEISRLETGKVIDITRKAEAMYEKSSKWANIAFRVGSADLSEVELDVISVQTESLLQQFLKNKGAL